ncbi:MAG: ABC transporter ATP-binding protein [Deltaproteobacteria bacterium]|jgi:oligopeptide/dipeptide ABC transporter ATP-binding protein|nr:ABC transporter ATP-binding protein [Deltaproteobacteria bacterium]
MTNTSPQTPVPPLLEIKDLAIGFGSGGYLPVKGLDFILRKGEVAGLVGESGSGKSLTAYGLMGLLPYGASFRRGQIIFKGSDILALPPRERRSLAGSSMGMIFQEPLTALNPVITVGEQVAEIFRIKLGHDRRQARESACALLSQVGLPNPRAAYSSYPHRFSGGMRQRVVIAMALALNPDLVIADEPTTALDPTIALQIIRLLADMTSQRGTGVLFITHNLRILHGLACRIFVMYAGLIMEETGERGMTDPVHPYTRGLVAALPPNPSQNEGKTLVPIPGQAPGPRDILPGCPFAPRCPEGEPRCSGSLPELLPVAGGGKVRCFKREANGAA